MVKLIASGTDVEAFKQAISHVSGRGVTTIELDVKDRFNIPLLPDPNVGMVIRRALPTLDATLKAIPGVHLVAPSTYSVVGNTGTLTVKLRTNPLPSLPVTVATAVIGILGPVGSVLTLILLSWRIYNDSPEPTPSPSSPRPRVPTEPTGAAPGKGGRNDSSDQPAVSGEKTHYLAFALLVTSIGMLVLMALRR